jgi:hypothetical protein
MYVAQGRGSGEDTWMHLSLLVNIGGRLHRAVLESDNLHHRLSWRGSVSPAMPHRFLLASKGTQHVMRHMLSWEA